MLQQGNSNIALVSIDEEDEDVDFEIKESDDNIVVNAINEDKTDIEEDDNTVIIEINEDETEISTEDII